MNYYSIRDGNVFLYKGNLRQYNGKFVVIKAIEIAKDESEVYSLETLNGDKLVSYRRDSELREILLTDEILTLIGFQPQEGNYFEYESFQLHRTFILKPNYPFGNFLGGVILYYTKNKDFPKEFESVEQVFEYATPIHHLHALQNLLSSKGVKSDYTGLKNYTQKKSLF